ncbi:MAG: polyphosphate polymerase domain-containing protein [Lachnospiraceae bacterium]|nr:polyphosphate polymerase domain-containing protein [Lachnospiraceae bacterium]
MTEQKTSGESFTLRKEIKYIVPLEKALILKSRLDNSLPRDEHCSDGAYSVRSLYFDSIENVDFAEKFAGIEKRKKIRVRIYNNVTSTCKLELKQKNGDWQQKHSFIISANDVSELAFGNYSVLTRYFHSVDVSRKVFSTMTLGQYNPVVQIEYDRLAYRYPMYDTRITLDMNIRSSETNMDIFASNIHYIPIMRENVVLEIKYSGKLMGFISAMLTQFNLTQSSCSKYCLGRKIYYDFN